KKSHYCIFAKRLSMDNTVVILVCIIIILIASFAAYLLMKDKKGTGNSDENIDPATRTLVLQAYERLTLLVDRIALPNLISRVNQNGVSAREMQLLLTRSLKEEFDYNITQQIYVSAEA